MFDEANYLNPGDEPATSVSVTKNGCTWLACLYERKSGGFDLFYDHASSDFSRSIPLDTITKLRHLCEPDRGIFFIAHLSEPKMGRKLFAEAERQLAEWVTATIGNV